MYLTRRQKEIFDFIKDFIKENGYAPSLDEIRSGLSLNSVATVHKHLKFLEMKKYIRREPHLSRAIELTDTTGLGGAVRVPLLGIIAAGRPIEAIPSNEDITIPEEFLGNSQTYVLRVRGNSMIEEQICDGDFVIIEDRKTARNGEVVVALINGEEATLKKYYDEGDSIRLQPANSEMAPIIIDKKTATVEVQGIVIGILRKY